MTDKPTPTDAELKALWQLHAADIGGIFYYARAVLAKWGQPAQAAEQVAVVVPCYTPSGKRVALYSAKQDLPIGTKLYTHPSPSDGMAGWISVDERLPEPGNPVLLDIGKKYPIRALWAAKNTVRVGTDVDDWGEYDEETDEYYCPEGWYEWNEHEEVHWAVSETPRAWRELPPPLPAAPGPADGESNGLHLQDQGHQS